MRRGNVSRPAKLANVAPRDDLEVRYACSGQPSTNKALSLPCRSGGHRGDPLRIFPRPRGSSRSPLRTFPRPRGSPRRPSPHLPTTPGITAETLSAPSHDPGDHRGDPLRVFPRPRRSPRRPSPHLPTTPALTAETLSASSPDPGAHRGDPLRVFPRPRRSPRRPSRHLPPTWLEASAAASIGSGPPVRSAPEYFTAPLAKLKAHDHRAAPCHLLSSTRTRR